MLPSHVFLHDVHRDSFTVTHVLHRSCLRLGLIGCGLWLAVWFMRERGILVTFKKQHLTSGDRPAYAVVCVTFGPGRGKVT